MKDLFFSSLSEHIGFTLMHSLWQGIIGVVLIIMISRFVSAKYSTLRYWLFVSIMLMVLIANIFTFSNQILGSTLINGDNPVSLTETILVTTQLTNTNSAVTDFWSTNIQQAMPYIVMFWWLGIMALFIKLAINLWQVRQLSRANHLPVSTEVIELFERIKARLKISKIIQLVQSKQVSVPSVIGHLTPIILLPIGLVNGLSNDQVEAILLHELSHIKRHDFLVNIIQSIVEVLYFFNPFMWVISKAIRDEREHACDDMAISLGISAPVYAQTLAGVFNYAINRQQFALSFASKNKLTLKRIQRIMKNQSNNNNKLMATMVFVIAITLSMYYSAQSNAPGQAITDMQPELAAMAMVAPTFSTRTSPVLNRVKENLAIDKLFQQERIIESDTIDPKYLKKHVEELDRAMDGLKATKEWQEVEQLHEKMVEEQMSYLEDLAPLMEDALRMSEESMELQSQELLEMEEQLERMSEVMVDIQIDKTLEMAMELNTEAIEESMRHLQEQMEEIDFEEMEKVAQVMAEEAKVYAAEAAVMAVEAEKIAAEAKKHVEAIEDFFDELKPLLIEDGYIKSSKDLDQLNFKDGEVFVNGEKVKAKDAKRYFKIHDKYFDNDDDFIMN
jgi:beta-lactamase regulating signal transducer with metallopeptidase domain